MGASNGSAMIEVKEGENIRTKFYALQSQLEYEEGHNGYNGTLSTCSDFTVKSGVPEDVDIDDHDAVARWIWDNTEKREAWAIEVSEGKWLVAGWVAE